MLFFAQYGFFQGGSGRNNGIWNDSENRRLRFVYLFRIVAVYSIVVGNVGGTNGTGCIVGSAAGIFSTPSFVVSLGPAPFCRRQ